MDDFRCFNTQDKIHKISMNHKILLWFEFQICCRLHPTRKHTFIRKRTLAHTFDLARWRRQKKSLSDGKKKMPSILMAFYWLHIIHAPLILISREVLLLWVSHFKIMEGKDYWQWAYAIRTSSTYDLMWHIHKHFTPFSHHSYLVCLEINSLGLSVWHT